MKVFRNLEEARAGFAACAVTIGNFDGVHAGHRALMERTVALARKLGVTPSALTFHPHPAVVVAPERAPQLLTTPEERARRMEEFGIGQVMVLPFDERVATMSPFQFVSEILKGALSARGVVVGDNFRFGSGQQGSTDTLLQLGQAMRLYVEIVPAVYCRGRLVSSSEVRKLLREGKVELAGRLLRRPFSLRGTVVRGEGRGSRETVPTLNLAPDTDQLPAHGVYVTRTTDLENGRRWNSVTNVGTRPTFQGQSVTTETFLLDPLEGETPALIQVEFLYRLRGEKAFGSAEELRAQILRDVSRAQVYFRRLQRVGSGQTVRI